MMRTLLSQMFCWHDYVSFRTAEKLEHKQSHRRHGVYKYYYKGYVIGYFNPINAFPPMYTLEGQDKKYTDKVCSKCFKFSLSLDKMWRKAVAKEEKNKTKADIKDKKHIEQCKRRDAAKEWGVKYIHLTDKA